MNVKPPTKQSQPVLLKIPSCSSCYSRLRFRLLWCWHQSTLHRGSPGGVTSHVPTDLQQQRQTKARCHLYCSAPLRLQQSHEDNRPSLSEGSGSPGPSSVPHSPATAGQLLLFGAESSAPSLPPCSVYWQGQHTWYGPRTPVWFFAEKFVSAFLALVVVSLGLTPVWFCLATFLCFPCSY